MDRFEAMALFVRVTHAGSFSAAADQLGVSRSVVTRNIAELERHLGTRLLTRTTRSLALTASGQTYFEECQAILKRLEVLESDIAQDQRTPRGRIRLSIPINYGLSEIFPRLSAFMHQHPEIEFDIDFNDQRINLAKEGMDLAIRITGDLNPLDRIQRISNASLVVVASPQYIQRSGEPDTPEALKNHACLLYANPKQSEPWVFTAGHTSHRIHLVGRMTANNGEALARAALDGLGIALLPEFIVRPWLSSGALVALLKPYACPRLGIFAVLPTHRQEPQRVRLLIDYLRTELSKP